MDRIEDVVPSENVDIPASYASLTQGGRCKVFPFKYGYFLCRKSRIKVFHSTRIAKNPGPSIKGTNPESTKVGFSATVVNSCFLGGWLTSTT